MRQPIIPARYVSATGTICSAHCHTAVPRDFTGTASGQPGTRTQPNRHYTGTTAVWCALSPGNLYIGAHSTHNQNQIWRHNVGGRGHMAFGSILWRILATMAPSNKCLMHHRGGQKNCAKPRSPMIHHSETLKKTKLFFLPRYDIYFVFTSPNGSLY